MVQLVLVDHRGRMDQREYPDHPVLRGLLDSRELQVVRLALQEHRDPLEIQDNLEVWENLAIWVLLAPLGPRVRQLPLALQDQKDQMVIMDLREQWGIQGKWEIRAWQDHLVPLDHPDFQEFQPPLLLQHVLRFVRQSV